MMHQFSPHTKAIMIGVTLGVIFVFVYLLWIISAIGRTGQ